MQIKAAPYDLDDTTKVTLPEYTLDVARCKKTLYAVRSRVPKAACGDEAADRLSLTTLAKRAYGKRMHLLTPALARQN